MKRTLSFMVMALALLLTQCRKPEVKFPTPSSAEGVTVSMTVTAGPGSKTDITDAGVITWSSGDKLYVGDGTHYVGYLTLQSGAGSATGTFSGDVTLTGITEGVAQTFRFFYLGSVDYTGSLTKGESTTVVVNFSSQNIYADVNNKADDNKKLVNASKHHVGYGTASGTVKDGFVTGINVTLVSKVAIAYFSFKDGTDPYYGALTLSGTGIYNSMKVNFGGTFTGEKTDGGNISLTGSHAERYVMLVPPANVAEETLNFGGAYEGTKTLDSGIEANKFYRMPNGSAIEVPVEKVKPFTVGMDNGKPRRVEFAPGNLYWDGSAFRFEANQWSFEKSWKANHVSHFKWSDATNAVTGDSSFSGDLFCASNFTVTGDSHTWRTLSQTEWNYLLYTRTNATSLRAWKDFGSGIKGLVILPDGTDASVMSSITKTSDLATHGAVFLPAAGYRNKTGMDSVGDYGYYWSSTPRESNYAYLMLFSSGGPNTNNSWRSFGYSVRLVR